jgi:hypothetical protein
LPYCIPDSWRFISLDALLELDDLRVGIGGKFPHHLQLDFRRHDLALELGGGFDCPPCLLLQGDDLVRLLELARVSSVRRSSRSVSGQAVGDEHALFAGFSRAKRVIIWSGG